MIQDIAPHHLDNTYHPVPPDRDSIALCYEGRACLMKKAGDEIIFPTFADLEEKNKAIYEDYIYLFRIDEERYYLVRDSAKGYPADFQMEDMEIFRRANPQHRAFAGATGHHLYGWYKKHQYCGQCGGPTKPDIRERMLYCEKCGSMEYPKICPAVIIGVTDGTRLPFPNMQGVLIKNMPFLPVIRRLGRPWRRPWPGRSWKKWG